MIEKCYAHDCAHYDFIFNTATYRGNLQEEEKEIKEELKRKILHRVYTYNRT